MATCGRIGPRQFPLNPPIRRNISVTVPSAPARVLSTVKVRSMSISRKLRMEKSNPSEAQPRNAAKKAFHWIRVMSRNLELAPVTRALEGV
jgi:hypothetical protein